MSSKKILKLKQEIRKDVHEKRRHQPDRKRARHSLKIWDRLKKLKEFEKAKRIMFYLAVPEEVETRQMIKGSMKLGKKILVPFINKKKHTMSACLIKDYNTEFEKGYLGIPEPKKELRINFNKKNIDLVVVPGIAFDLKGARIGFGGGYYDRFLKTLRKKVKIALAFDFQIKPQLPYDLHDIKMDKILTEKEVIVCRQEQDK